MNFSPNCTLNAFLAYFTKLDSCSACEFSCTPNAELKMTSIAKFPIRLKHIIVTLCSYLFFSNVSPYVNVLYPYLNVFLNA